jgi:transcriptional regulator with XRE-family HTH domain
LTREALGGGKGLQAASLGTRVRAAREAAGLSQQELALAVGIKQPSVQAIESGRAKGTKHIVAIAQVTGRSPEWLAMGEEPRASTSRLSIARGGMAGTGLVDVLGIEFARINIYDTRDYGRNAQLVDFHLLSLAALRSVTQAPIAELVGFKIDDDSMAPTLGPQDWVFIDRSRARPAGPGLYALDVEGDVAIQRVNIHVAGGPLTLICDNPKYPPRTIDDPASVTFIGRAFMKLVRC